MKHIYLNLKRFEIPREFGGVNGIARPAEWAGKIYEETDRAICQYCEDDIDFAMYLPDYRQFLYLPQPYPPQPFCNPAELLR